MAYTAAILTKDIINAFGTRPFARATAAIQTEHIRSISAYTAAETSRTTLCMAIGPPNVATTSETIKGTSLQVKSLVRGVRHISVSRMILGDRRAGHTKAGIPFSALALPIIVLAKASRRIFVDRTAEFGYTFTDDAIRMATAVTRDRTLPIPKMAVSEMPIIVVSKRQILISIPRHNVSNVASISILA